MDESKRSDEPFILASKTGLSKDVSVTKSSIILHPDVHQLHAFNSTRFGVSFMPRIALFDFGQRSHDINLREMDARQWKLRNEANSSFRRFSPDINMIYPYKPRDGRPLTLSYCDEISCHFSAEGIPAVPSSARGSLQTTQGEPVKMKRKRVTPGKSSTTEGDSYLERRKRNNASAKKSRDARKIQELQTQAKAAFFQVENFRMREELAAIQEEKARLRRVLIDAPRRH